MANIESDATYCSEVEKENQPERRRSQRLSQKLSHSFRPNVKTASQRFEEIHQTLKSTTTYNDWSKHDWLALKYEVGSILKSLKGIARSRITYVEKKINQHIRQAGASASSNSLAEILVEPQNDNNGNISYEAVKSPNILAGMTTDVLTELPPYQPDNMSNIMRAAPSIAVTQVNPLDLTKKILEKQSNTSLEKESCLEPKSNEGDKNRRPPTKDVSKDSMIDLTEDISVQPCEEVPEPKATSSKPTMHTSKWLKFVPTQEKPKVPIEKQNAPLPLKDKSKSFKHSLVKLYKDQSSSNNKPRSNRSSSKQPHKDSKAKQRPLHNTEGPLGQHFGQQPDRMSRSLSPDFFAEELLQPDRMDLIDDADSMTSLPFSLKNSFKKIFGTDCLDDVFGCEKVIYSLTAGHVGRLAIALNVKCDSLKQTIEQILSDDNAAVPDNDAQSVESVVECSQSPPHRLFPSQRSQLSK